MARTEDLTQAVDLAIAGDWDGAHAIAQRDESDPHHRWLHAVLHKIEGDDFNSRYWYRDSGHSYDEFPSPEAELIAIRAALQSGGLKS
jgi:hypothetical protein